MNSPQPSKNHKFNRNFAIIIGINEYVNHTKLKAAVNDAKRLAVFLGNEKRKEQPGGNEWYQVLLLTDEDATYEKLTKVFQKLEEGEIYFPGQTIQYHDKGVNKDKMIEVPKEEPVTLQKKDRLLVYFAGHGCLSEGLQLVCQDGKNFSAKELQQKISIKSPCDHKLLILDCCYSGAARENSQKQQPIYRTPGNSNKIYNEDFIALQRPTFTVITSGGYAKVPDGEEHSPFSDALLEAFENGICLGKEVDSNNDNILTVEEIYNYIVGDNRVKQKQHPELIHIHITSLETISGQYFFLLPDFNPNDLVTIGNIEKPYKGLFAYEEEDKSIFCGRNELVNKLFARVNQDNQKLTIVTGASGSGKSSLVKAGLIPRLKDSNTSPTASEQSDKPNQAKQWTILTVMRPGESPLTALARTILPIYDKDLLNKINTEINKILPPQTEQSSQKSTPNDKINNQIKNMSMLINDLDKLKKECGDNQHKNQQLEELKKEAQEEANEKLNELVSNFNQDSQQETNKLIKQIKSWSVKTKIKNAHVLLFIDQFEELITLSQAQEKKIFLDLLVQLVKESENLHIVLTVRSDFEIYFRGSSKSNDSSNSINQYWNAETRLVVEEMNSDQLRKAIIIPARRFIDNKNNKNRMLGFESEKLVSNIIDDVRGMPGGLALLSFTLDKLYKLASEDTHKKNTNKIIIKRKDYDELGGVSGALTKRATEVYNNLSEATKLQDNDKKFTKKYEQECKAKVILIEDKSAGEVRQAMMKQLILRMVTTQGGKLAKRPVPISELQYPDWRCRYKNATYRMYQVIDELIKERLIVSNSYESNKGSKGNNNEEICYVEPAHDALILYWNKLHKKDNTEQQQEQNKVVQEQGWLEEEEDNLVLRDRLIAAIQDWQEWEEERKKTPPKFLRSFKYQKQTVALFNILNKGYNFIWEIDIRYKILQRIRKFLFRFILIFWLGFLPISIGLSWIFDPELLIFGLFLIAFGLFCIFPKFAFQKIMLTIHFIFFNSIREVYRLFTKIKRFLKLFLTSNL